MAKHKPARAPGLSVEGESVVVAAPAPPPVRSVQDIEKARRQHFAKAEVPAGYTGPTIAVECHRCGLGIGATLGQLKVPADLGELVDAGKLSCPKCGQPDVSRVRIDDRVQESLDLASLRAAHEQLKGEHESVQAELAELRRRAAANPPLPPMPSEPDQRPPARGQHTE